MKTFRGPIDGFNNGHEHDDDDLASDSDDEGGGGGLIVHFGNLDSDIEGDDDDDDEFEDVIPGIGGGEGAAHAHAHGHGPLDFGDSDDGDGDGSDDDEHDVEFGSPEVLASDEEIEEGGEGSGSGSDVDAESLPDADDMEEVPVHDDTDANYSGSPVVAPSPGGEVEIESDLMDSPAVPTVEGRSRIAEISVRPVPDDGDSSSELSELSEPEDVETSPQFLKVNLANGALTPTLSTVSRSEGVDSPRILESANVTEDEGEGESNTAYSNPMISAEDETDSNRNGSTTNPEAGEDDENLMQLRGDCIGSTTYSERHVLKILIKWMERIEVMKNQEQKEDEKMELETEFDNELSFLWDMSSERDVAIYLSEKDVFSLLRESLTLTECDRLVEIAIGILVNLLSVPAILNTFPAVEAKVQLIPAILSDLLMCRRIPRLIQALAFLRRLVWYMSTNEVVEAWMGPLTEVEFIQAVNFLLKSCRNIGILSELVTILFMLLEIIRDSPKLLKVGIVKDFAEDASKNETSDNLEDDSESSSSDEDNENDESVPVPKQKDPADITIGKHNKRIIYEFCKHGLVISLCESAQELLKYPVIDSGMWPNTTTAGRGDTNEDQLQVIPPNAIQESICLGLNTFEFIHKIKSCREFLYEDAAIIINIYVEFFHRFHLYTQHVNSDVALDHFGEGLKLIGYYQSRLPTLVSKSVIIKPLNAARKFKQSQETINRDKHNSDAAAQVGSSGSNGQIIASEDDLVTPIAILVHEFLSQLGEKFQLEKIHKIILDEKNEKLSRFLEFVNVAVQNIHQECLAQGQATMTNSNSVSEDVSDAVTN